MRGRDCISAPVPLGDVTKFGRGDSASPAPPTTLAQPQQSQSQAHHTAQQPFLSPALPPGYSYPGLPYYTGVPSAFQYGPTMFVSIGGGVPPAPGSRSREGGQVPTRAHLALKNGSRLGFLFHLLGDLAGVALVMTRSWWLCHLLPEAELGDLLPSLCSPLMPLLLFPHPGPSGFS